MKDLFSNGYNGLCSSLHSRGFDYSNPCKIIWAIKNIIINYTDGVRYKDVFYFATD
jgi:hypothetical protein